MAVGTAARADEPPATRFSGVVTDAVTHEPVVGATVMLRELKRGAITRSDGRFSIEGIPSGRYTLVVTSVGYAPLEDPLTLEEDLERKIELTPRTVQLSEVHVTGRHDDAGLTASPQSVTVISPVDMAKMRGQTLGESLKDVAGVTTLSTGPSIAKPVIRGLHSQRLVIVNAGVQQEGQQWGAEHAPEIDPFAPATIQVVRGAAGVEFGAGAIGGVIRLTPQPLPEGAGLGGELNLNGFSNNMQGSGSLMLEGSTALVPGLGARVQGSVRKAGDARTAEYVMGNSGFEEIDGSAAIGYHHENFGADLYLSHFGTTLGIFKGSHVNTVADLKEAIQRGRPAVDYTFGYEIAPPKQEIGHDAISLAGHYIVPSVGRLELQYGWQYNHRKEYDAHNVRLVNDSGTVNTSRASFELGLTTNSLGLKLRHNPVAGVAGTIGVEGMQQENARGGSIKLIPGFHAATIGAFIVENAEVGNWVFNAGARFDYRRLEIDPLLSRGIVAAVHTYSGFSGALGAVYRIAPEWSLGTNLAAAWRPPSVNELYSNDVHHGSAQYEIGDLGLPNERSYGADATLKHVGERSHAELSIYANRIENYIYLQPDPEPIVTIRGAYPVMRYRHTNALLTGLDGSVDYRVLDPLRLALTFSIVRGDNLGTGEPLIQMPGDRLRFSAHLDLPESPLMPAAPYFEAGARLVRRQDRFPAGVDFVDPPPGYALLDAAVGGRLHLFGQPVSFMVSVENLLNASYRDYLSRFRYFTDDPGRNIILRLNVPFGALDHEEPTP